MVTAAILICVSTSVTMTRPHQGKSKIPEKSINSPSNSKKCIGFMRRLKYTAMDVCATLSARPAAPESAGVGARVGQNPHFPLRIGNLDAGVLKSAPDVQIQVGTDAEHAVLRIIDPDPQLEVDAAVGK